MIHISQTTLLFNAYLLTNLSLRVATASVTSLTPNIFKHSAAISNIKDFSTTRCENMIQCVESVACEKIVS